MAAMALRRALAAAVFVAGSAAGDLSTHAAQGETLGTPDTPDALERLTAASLRLDATLARLEGSRQAAETLVTAGKCNPHWAAAHEAELEEVAASLEAAETRLRGLEASSQVAGCTGDQLGAASGSYPMSYLTSLSDNLGPFILFSLCVVAVALMFGRRPLDLFSADVHSPIESALAFTLASLTALGLVYGRAVPTVSSNPISLYLWELLASFAAVSTTIPLLLGTTRSSKRAAAIASTIAVAYYGGLWLSSDTPVLWCLVDPMRFLQRDPLFLGPAIVLSLLYLALVCLNIHKLVGVLGAKRQLFRPFHQVWPQRCRDYVCGRFRGPVSADRLPPVALPAALLVPVVGVTAATCNALFISAFTGWSRYHDLQRFVEALLGPANVLFRWAGYPLDAGSAQYIMTRILASYYAALLLATVYVAWLLRMVVVGYKRMFRDLALGRGYHGQELAAASGPSVFHPQWASYAAGALVGNAALAAVLIVLVAWPVILVLIMPQFWQLQWSIRSWWIFYGLLYTTRKSIFLFVIPRYVVTDTGVVLRPRLWALLFPTLLLLNFVLGATSGVIRFIVMLPYLLCQFFRVDITFLPGSYCAWDWSYHPFVSLVLHAHRKLNPILQATVMSLAADNQLAASTAPVQQEEAEAAPTASAAAVDEEAPEAGGCQSQQDLARARSAPATTGRARQRWHLAVVLARNPHLRSLRCHDIQRSVASAPGRIEGGTGACKTRGVEPLQLPLTALSARQESTTFYSPLNDPGLQGSGRASGLELPLLPTEEDHRG